MRRLSPIRRRRFRGFTLLEVLVAVSLSLLLMSAVYAGIHMYWRYSTAGQADVEQAQLARSLLRRIELDVRSALYRAAPPASASQSSTSGSSTSGSSGSGSSGSSSSGSGSSGSSSSSGSSGSGSSSSSQTTTTTTTPDDAYGTSTTGLFGNATTLLIHVSKPGREQAAAILAATGNQQTRLSDLATVAYFVSGAATGTLQQAASGSGLARLEGDRLALAMADQQGNAGAMAAQTQILASEVTALRFMYYDGFRWRPDWDSTVLGGLPKAIEVEMQLRPAAGGSSHSMTYGPGSPNFYRLVIALPLAKPVDSIAAQAQ
jgi:prepilin-type N-terminal cleavage/methylation domain-containing protein